MLGSLVLMAFLIEKNDQGKRFLIIPLLSDKGTCTPRGQKVQENAVGSSPDGTNAPFTP